MIITTTYKTQSEDTDIISEMVLFALWRSWDKTKKAIHLNHNTHNARSTAWHIAKTYLPNKSQQINYFLRKVLNLKYINKLSVGEKITMTGVIEETLIVAKILESLGISYHVGGSVASGIWGEMRYTQDIDLVVDIQESQIQLLVNAFSPRFYISEIAVREAIALRRSFNLIDNETGWKIDIFILDDDPFQLSRFHRKKEISVNDMGESLNFSSAEDTILQKLIWYRQTQKQSTQQWRDILGIFKLQQSELDFTYLQVWAKKLKLSTELELALQESSY
ncbi:hypothetical protein [Cyanobacterium sp. Dongsha4]|uniref:hypothetical protein n=1 Tax=Cyanobacterium sp. DS4 TaxID=2878255 RepID=UPI002E8205FE|nr:hypothetical protein [Cyanobacterium sp. Dongsha4]WVK99573.1 hypothetical protein Dongsha4_12890 [Cyanobacterium sp. Dongsha4]